MRDAIRYFPARPPTPDERALVAEWLASVGDIAATYVSNRLGDDPAHYRRIVIVTRQILAGRDPQQLIGRECLQHLVLPEKFNELASDFAETYLADRQPPVAA